MKLDSIFKIDFKSLVIKRQYSLSSAAKNSQPGSGVVHYVGYVLHLSSIPSHWIFFRGSTFPLQNPAPASFSHMLVATTHYNYLGRDVEYMIGIRALLALIKHVNLSHHGYQILSNTVSQSTHVARRSHIEKRASIL